MYITQWSVGIKHISDVPHSDGAFSLELPVFLQGKASDGRWLPKLSTREAPDREFVNSECQEGFARLTVRGGAWLTKFLDFGDDRDDEMSIEAPADMTQPCRVIGYRVQLTNDRNRIASARIKFASATIKTRAA